MLDIINNDNNNRILSDLDYLDGLGKWVTESQETKLIKAEDLDYHINSIQRVTRDFKIIIYNYNAIYSESAYFPYIVDGWLQEFRSDLNKFKNRTDSKSSIVELTSEDLKILEKYHDPIKQINIVSKDIFSYDSGISYSTLDSILEKGFINYQSLMKWLQKIEEIIISSTLH